MPPKKTTGNRAAVANAKKKPIEQYEHKGKKRANNPPVGLVDAKSDGLGVCRSNHGDSRQIE